MSPRTIAHILNSYSLFGIHVDKQEFYGKSNNPFEEKAVNKHGHTAFQVHKTGQVAVGIGIDQDGSVESSLVDMAENQGTKYSKPNVDPHDVRKAAQAVIQRADSRPSSGHDMMNASLYQQAASMRNSSHYQVDDYSFSTINIHNIPKDDVVPPKNSTPSSSGFLKMPKWMESFAPGNVKQGYSPPEYGIPANITSNTNLAPPIRGNHQDWWSSSPKVTFDIDQEKKSRWSHLSHTQRLGAGVIWVALMCTLMGVTIWSLNKPQEEVYQGDRSSSVQGFIPTSGGIPTVNPTDTPSRPPTTRSPVSGYSRLHGKVRCYGSILNALQ